MSKNFNPGQFIGTYKRKKIPDTPKIRFNNGTQINRTKEVVKLVQAIADQDQEYAVVITLTQNLKVIDIRVVAIGSNDEATVSERHVFRGAIIDNAYGIIFVHNHPGGTLKPTSDDKKFVKSLKKAGKILQVEVLDSIIVHGKNWKSMFKEERKNA